MANITVIPARVVKRQEMPMEEKPKLKVVAYEYGIIRPTQKSVRNSRFFV